MDNHASALDDVPTTVQTPPPESVAGGFLNRIFGSHQEKVQQGVQQASGLDFQKVKKLLATLSPLVLSALARRKATNQSEADSNQVGSLLRREAQKAQEEAPHVGGLLGQLLGA